MYLKPVAFKEGFNSSLVNCELGRPTSTASLRYTFQLLIGKLRTRHMCIRSRKKLYCFNSSLVNCELIGEVDDPMNLMLFQLLIGKLRTFRYYLERLTYLLFQLLIGKLRTLDNFKTLLDIFSVSTPHW